MRNSVFGVGKPSTGFGGSMVARLELEGIDGRAPPGMEPAAQFESTRGILQGHEVWHGGTV